MIESAIIFGGSKGIGKSIGDYLLEQGTQVTVAARTELICEPSISNLNCVSVDIGSLEQVESAFEAHQMAYASPPQVVINTAATQGPIGYSWQCNHSQWQDSIHTNLVGSYNVAIASIRFMMARASGSIILFSGGGAAYSRPHFSSYAVSKTGVLRLVEVLSDELRLAGYPSILINAVAPGAVKTSMTETILHSEVQLTTAEMSSAEETSRTGGTQVNLIFSLIDFLCNQEVNGKLSGRLIHVRENYRELVNRFHGNMPEDIGKLRRVPIL